MVAVGFVETAFMLRIEQTLHRAEHEYVGPEGGGTREDMNI